MAIRVYLDDVLRARGMTAKELCAKVGITEANLSILRSGKARGVRFGTLNRICYYLECDAGDILKFDGQLEEENDAKKGLLATILAALLLLSGCSLALPEEDGKTDGDPMVGVLVTTQPLDLFDSEAYLRENASTVLNGGMIRADDAEKYSNALFTVWDDTQQRYVFPDTEGYVWLCTEESDESGDYTRMQNDDVFCDGTNAVHVTDEGSSYEFSATLYVPNDRTYAVFYCNPIYQTADGRVYALAGQGMSCSGEAGSTAAITQTLTQTLTETQKGETQTRSFECAIKVQLAARPERVTLFWMDAESGLLRSEEYAAGTLPETLRAEDAEFLLAVETAVDGTQSRALYGPEQETQTLETLFEGDKGFLQMQYTQLEWPQQSN